MSKGVLSSQPLITSLNWQHLFSLSVTPDSPSGPQTYDMKPSKLLTVKMIKLIHMLGAFNCFCFFQSCWPFFFFFKVFILGGLLRVCSKRRINCQGPARDSDIKLYCLQFNRRYSPTHPQMKQCLWKSSFLKHDKDWKAYRNVFPPGVLYPAQQPHGRKLYSNNFRFACMLAFTRAFNMHDGAIRLESQQKHLMPHCCTLGKERKFPRLEFFSCNKWKH